MKIKKKNIIIFVIACSLVLLLLFSSCSYSDNNKQSELDYYSIRYNNGYYFVKDNSVLVKDDNEKEKTLFKENENILLIGIENDVLYYETSSKNNTFKIKKYELDNKNNVVLIDSSKNKKLKNEYLHRVKLKNNNLFIQMSYEFFVFDIKNNKLDKYVDDVREFQIKDNNLYFINGSFDFYKLSLKDKSKEVIIKSSERIKCSGFLIVNDNFYLYSSNAKKLYLINNQGKLTSVDKGNIEFSSLTDYKNELYYIAKIKNKYILFKLDKSNNKQEITECKDYSSGLEIINDKIYYINSNDELIYQNLD